MQAVAKVISWVFHPLFIPLYAFLTLLTLDPYVSTFFPVPLRPFFISLLVINIAAPAVSILLMKKRGAISSLEMEDRKERIAPIFIVLFYYAVSYALLRFNSYPIPELIYAMMLGMIISIGMALFITSWWKISMHAMAIAGVLGAFAGIYSHYQYANMIIVFALVFLIGLVGFARILPRHHSLGQVYGGIALGLLVNFAVVSSFL